MSILNIAVVCRALVHVLLFVLLDAEVRFLFAENPELVSW